MRETEDERKDERKWKKNWNFSTAKLNSKVTYFFMHIPAPPYNSMHSISRKNLPESRQG